MPKTRAAKAPPPLDMAAAPARKTRAPKVTPTPAPPVPVMAPVEVEVDVIVPPPVPTLRKKALVEQVVQATGAKRKQVKDVVEATLAALGEALSRGDELNLPPLGRARVNRTKGEGDAALLIVKLRRGGGKGGKEALAEPDEAD